MSGLTNAWPPPAGGVPRPTSADAYAPCAQLDEKVDSAELIARSEPIADASLPDMRARRRPGTAIAAMMPMIATTMSSSISVKPLFERIFMSVLSSKGRLRVVWIATGPVFRGVHALPEQPRCQSSIDHNDLCKS